MPKLFSVIIVMMQQYEEQSHFISSLLTITDEKLVFRCDATTIHPSMHLFIHFNDCSCTFSCKRKQSLLSL